MVDQAEVDEPRRSSRRSVIKKGIVAGGVVWAAPVVSSLAAGADQANSGNCVGVGVVQVFTSTTDQRGPDFRRISATISGLGCQGPGCQGVQPTIDNITWVATNDQGSCLSGSTLHATFTGQDGNDAIIQLLDCGLGVGVPHRINLKVTFTVTCPDSGSTTICRTMRVDFIGTTDPTCGNCTAQPFATCSTVC